MARNVEIMARVTDPQAMRFRIESVGAIGPDALVQTDTFFNVPVVIPDSHKVEAPHRR